MSMPADVKEPDDAGIPSPEAFPRRYQGIARDIMNAVQADGFSPGDRLPTERDLAVRLSISRSSVREAMIALEIAGVVEVRAGSGTYLLRNSYSASSILRNFLANDPGPGPFEILEVRRLVEAETAFRAASQASEAQLRAISASFEMMREGVATGSDDVGDRAFHILIAEASGNSAFALVLRDLWAAMSMPLWKRYQEQVRTPEMYKQRIAEHAAVLERLLARDAAGARQAMVDHFDGVIFRFGSRPGISSS